MKTKIISIFIIILFINFILNTIAIASYNNPPNPPIIQGPTSGKKGEYYDYTFTLTDPDPDDVLFNLEINFGDDETIYEDCGCGKAWQNGTIITVNHRWKNQGNYEITARVQDASGEWSEWSESFIVSMSKSYSKSNIQNIFNQLIEKFTIFLNLLTKIK